MRQQIADDARKLAPPEQQALDAKGAALTRQARELRALTDELKDVYPYITDTPKITKTEGGAIFEHQHDLDLLWHGVTLRQSVDSQTLATLTTLEIAE